MMIGHETFEGRLYSYHGQTLTTNPGTRKVHQEEDRYDGALLVYMVLSWRATFKSSCQFKHTVQKRGTSIIYKDKVKRSTKRNVENSVAGIITVLTNIPQNHLTHKLLHSHSLMSVIHPHSIEPRPSSKASFIGQGITHVLLIAIFESDMTDCG